MYQFAPTEGQAPAAQPEVEPAPEPAADPDPEPEPAAEAASVKVTAAAAAHIREALELDPLATAVAISRTLLAAGLVNSTKTGRRYVAAVKAGKAA